MSFAPSTLEFCRLPFALKKSIVSVTEESGERWNALPSKTVTAARKGTRARVSHTQTCGQQALLG